MRLARILPTGLKRALRRVLDAGGGESNRGDPAAAGVANAYSRWLERQVTARGSAYPLSAQPTTFSILTTVYEKTDAGLLRETAASLFAQSLAFHEWVLLSHGPVHTELDTLLDALGADERVKVHRLPTNLGIVGGMRFCLEAARGEYVVAMDADDLLTADALQILASAIATHGGPAMLYSDEDILLEGVAANPYLRPDWDPVLNLANSYVWHLCAFRRDLALALDIYGDVALNWCHDWDTITHFANAGHVPHHVREILYHWRAHSGSTTNRSGLNQESLDSTRHLLEQQVARSAHPERYRLAHFPISRGTPEWHISRRHDDPAPLDLVVAVRDADRALLALGSMEKHLDYRPTTVTLCLPPTLPRKTRAVLEQYARALMLKTSRGEAFGWIDGHDVAALAAAIGRGKGTLVWLCSDAIELDDGETPWEALRLTELHLDVAMACGRLVGSDGRIASSGGLLSRSGEIVCMMHGRAESDAGPFALRLKQHSVSAPASDLILARSDFLQAAFAQMPASATLQGLAMWLAGAALERRARIAYSPLIRARCRGPLLCTAGVVAERERDVFLQRYGALLPDTKLSESRYQDLRRELAG